MFLTNRGVAIALTSSLAAHFLSLARADELPGDGTYDNTPAGLIGYISNHGHAWARKLATLCDVTTDGNRTIYLSSVLVGFETSKLRAPNLTGSDGCSPQGTRTILADWLYDGK